MNEKYELIIIEKVWRVLSTHLERKTAKKLDLLTENSPVVLGVELEAAVLP